MEFTILVIRMAMLFHPLRIFVPLAALCGLLGISKVAVDIMLLFPRISSFGWSSLLNQPVLSTSSLLLLLGALQLLFIGMVADGVLRRLSQQKRINPSHAIWVTEVRSTPTAGKQEISVSQE